jgi:hypothetical protein
MNAKHTDSIIIGAGLSGIGAACHLPRKIQTKPMLFLKPEQHLEIPGVCFNIQESVPIRVCTLLAIPLKHGRIKSRSLTGLLF